MDIEIRDAAHDDRTVIQNMGTLYVYDLSEFLGWPCPDDGLYACRSFASYWDEPDRWPFVVRVGGELADTLGTAPETDYNVGEFFILRKFRRRGVGSHVARTLFERFGGRWEIMQLLRNGPAIAFWRAVVAAHTRGHYAEALEFVPLLDREMNILRFASQPRRGTLDR